MHIEETRWGGAAHVRRAAVVLAAGWGLFVLGGGCAGTPVDPEGGERAGSAEQASTCLTVQNTGAVTTQVDDAIIVTDPSDPTKANTSYGGVQQMNVGAVGTGYQRILLKFDLLGAGVPGGAIVTSATLNVRLVQSLGKNPVDLHAGTGLWDESTVTWNSFAASPSGGLGALEATITTFGVPNNTILSIPLSATTVATWLTPSTNDGLVFDHPTAGRTVFASSEGPAAARPKLVVCYDLPSCNDGSQNQGETGVDCGGPCAACPSCNDGAQNQGETDIDCGGPSCGVCGDGLACSADADCQSGSCVSGVCGTSGAGGAGGGGSGSASAGSGGSGGGLVSGPDYALAYALGDPGLDVRRPVSATFNASSELVAYVWDLNAFTMGNEHPTVGTNVISDSGHTDLVAWGRWNGGTTGGNFYGATPSFLPNQGYHYVIAPDPSPVGGLSGGADYVVLGATHPTVADGGAPPGSFTGHVHVTFGAPTLLGIQLSPVAGGVPYTIQSAAYPAGTNELNENGGFFGGVLGTTGAGTCGGSCQSYVQGFFAHGGQILCITYQVGTTVHRISGTVAFTRQ